MESGMNFNPHAYEELTCTECGHNVFVPGVVFKQVPGLLLGQADIKTVPFPIKVACCAKCGTISQADKEELEREAEIAKKAANANKGGIII
jgi:DNA-directed RNA polymerase subunit RPC12/RpoP